MTSVDMGGQHRTTPVKKRGVLELSSHYTYSFGLAQTFDPTDIDFKPTYA